MASGPLEGFGQVAVSAEAAPSGAWWSRGTAGLEMKRSRRRWQPSGQREELESEAGDPIETGSSKHIQEQLCEKLWNYACGPQNEAGGPVGVDAKVILFVSTERTAW